MASISRKEYFGRGGGGGAGWATGTGGGDGWRTMGTNEPEDLQDLEPQSVFHLNCDLSARVPTRQLHIL